MEATERQRAPGTRAGAIDQGRQAGPNVAGGHDMTERPKEAKALRYSDKLAHAKAVRRIAAQYEGFGQWELEYLAGLHTYLLIEGREDIGVSEQRFIHFTGARGRWIKNMYEAGRKLITLGGIERFKMSPGTAIDLTEKGKRILEAYYLKYEELQEEFKSRQIINAIQAETMRIKRLSRKAAQAKKEATRQAEAAR